MEYLDDKKSILIAQSSENWLKVLQHIFSDDKNVILFSAQNVQKAIKLLKNKSIDLIITGLHFDEESFPYLEGIKLLEESLAYKPQVPIIILTGGPTSINERVINRFPNVVEIYYKATQFSIKDFHDVVFKRLHFSEKDIKQPIYVEEETITFPINGNWLATDFLYFFNSIRNAYSFFLITCKDLLKDLREKESIDDIWYYMQIGLFEKANALEVRRISYASPGNISFKGLGEPIKEIKNLFESLFLIVIKWKKEKAELELKHQQIKEKEIDLTRKEQENNLSIKKMEFDNMIDIEMKQLSVVEKRIDVMKKWATIMKN
ncbi:MAG: hypothetical protein ACLFPR_05085 [Desulfococcaceae bacterium]